MSDSDPAYIEERTALRNYEQRKEALRDIGTTRIIYRLIRDLFKKGRK